MKTLDVQQGTQAWAEARARHFCASEAAAMLGLDKRTSRAELLRMKATGSEREFSDWQQKHLLDRGHEIEAAAREIADELVGQTLYPATGVLEVDGLPLLASFDGITMDDSITWECKSRNADLIAALEAGDLPDTHWPQVEQQLLISGAGKALFTAGDGTQEGTTALWYESKPERRARLVAGWRQFAEDLKTYTPPEIIPAAVAAPVKDLPAIVYRLDGLSLTSNFHEFREAAVALIDSTNKPLVTDQDFADRDALNKKFRESEGKLKLLRDQVIGEITDVNQFCRNLDEVREMVRQAAIAGENAVKAEKENRKNAIILKAKDALFAHVAALNEKIGKPYMPSIAADFAGKTKGLKSLDSIQNAVDAELARARFEADQIASRIQFNMNFLRVNDGYSFLFADAPQLVLKDADACEAIIKSRIAEHKAEEERKLEAERARIRAEEEARAAEKLKAEQEEAERQQREREEAEARAQREAQESAAPAPAASQNSAAAPAAPTLAQVLHAAAPAAVAHAIAPITDNGARIKLGEINAQLAPLSITADGLAQLGFQPVGKERAAVLYKASDFPAICAAIISRVHEAASNATQKAAA